MKVLVVTFMAAMFLIGMGCTRAPSKKTDASPAVTAPGVSEISPQQARPAIEAAYSQFVDVRTPEEFASGHAERTINIPLDTLSANLDRLEKNEPVYLICQTGHRSKQAAETLTAAGFKQAISVAGGTTAWQAAGLPTEPPAAN